MTDSRRITGTHVYSYAKCPRLAALDLHLPRSERRPPTEWEEFAAQRGRDFEAAFVRHLGVVAPEYPDRDFAAGAAATLGLLRRGVPWIHQAVLLADDALGLPDLLRCVPGASALGDWHYEVLDVKTSGRPRGEQILQVVHYSALLAGVQGRPPEHAALILKDGREERFAIADYAAAYADVLAELRRLRADPTLARPFLHAGCSGCYHDERCLAELTAAGDLSLVQGMSHGARAILEAVGCRSVQDLAAFHPEGARARGHLEPALIRRLRRGAQAHLAGRMLVEERPRVERHARAAIVHLLTDPYADRLLACGTLSPAVEDGAVRCELPATPADEWPALERLLSALPQEAAILHFGEALPRWLEAHALQGDVDHAFDGRLVDVQQRLLAAAVFPRAVFGLADMVREGLRRDPLRAGHAGAAAMWRALPDGDERLRRKLAADLRDLAALKAAILDAAPLPAAAPAVTTPRAAHESS